MESYLGLIMPWAGNYAPQGWMFCQGQILSVAQNSALFSLLGARYGGDGRTTFALPNLQQRIVVGANGATGLAQQTGQDTVTLTADNLPPHNHGVSVVGTYAGTTASPDPKGNYLSATVLNDKDYRTAGTVTQLAANAIGTAGAAAPAAFSVVQPVLSLNFVICVSNGIYPARP